LGQANGIHADDEISEKHTASKAWMTLATGQLRHI
jgi:hypothetical protein